MTPPYEVDLLIGEAEDAIGALEFHRHDATVAARLEPLVRGRDSAELDAAYARIFE